MYFSIPSPCSDSSCYENWDAILRPRSPVPDPKGGGGHGAGHSSSKGGSSGSKGSNGATGKAAVGSRGSTTVPVSGTTFGSGKTASTAYGPGGVRVTTIPQGQPFAGRTYGGGTRGEIYGSS